MPQKKKATPPPPGALALAFPYVAALIAEGGTIALGYEYHTGSYVRAIIAENLIWEGGDADMTLEQLLLAAG